MTLEMYIDEKLVDGSPLSLQAITDPLDREEYIQGAANTLLEKWEDLMEDQNLQAQFFIKGKSAL